MSTNFTMGSLQETKDVVLDMLTSHDYITIGVRDGDMNEDDVLSAAMVLHSFRNINILRSRLGSDLRKCNFVCGIGKVDAVDETDLRIWVDNHQKVSEFYSDGVKMPSCGKLFDILYHAGCFRPLNDVGAEYVIRHIIKPVNTDENGVDIQSSLLKFVDYFNDNEPRDVSFYNAVELAETIFDKVLNRARDFSADVELFNKTLDIAFRNGSNYLYFDKEIPWSEIFLGCDNEYINSIKYIMFPHNKKGIVVRTLHVEGKVPDQKYIPPIGVDKNSITMYLT